jgi:energy-coupling factor transporter transmembrane protein EcfT
MKFISLVYTSIETASLINVLGTVVAFCVVFFFVFATGDFWFIWLWFHIVFVLPGIVALPSVQKWITQELASDGSDEGEGNEAAPTTADDNQ